MSAKIAQLLAYLAILTLIQKVHGQSFPQGQLFTSAAAIHALSPAEADKAYPVRLEAVVTYYDPEWFLLFVEDETGGIYLHTENVNLGLKEGDQVLVQGVTASGDYKPIVRQEANAHACCCADHFATV
jgi:hypothetical protein